MMVMTLEFSRKTLIDQKSLLMDESFSTNQMVAASEDVLEAKVADVHLSVSMVDNFANVAGAADTEVEYRCARCLEPFTASLHAPVEERYSWNEQEAKRIDAVYAPDDKVILDDLVEESLLLALPSVPLCRADCRGLCQECGQNLNMADCSCEKRKVDPRLEILKDLLSSPESE
ncbi:uncharacterized protein SAMN05443507_109103 [Alicyclobacillus tolerans]|uniref:DUF177 domain-containing protein n=2 Tax=Alicyclobacillus tolerans TaxID=90970 RepID=A0A1M6Q9V8_9BACL|nr:uncharacterized protein SAMN05443507_109103 [Alicyclobacillus montanus]